MSELEGKSSRAFTMSLADKNLPFVDLTKKFQIAKYRNFFSYGAGTCQKNDGTELRKMTHHRTHSHKYDGTAGNLFRHSEKVL